MKQSFLIFLFSSIIMGVAAQEAVTSLTRNPKMDELIAALEATQFIKDYKAYRSDTEAKIMEIKIETQLDVKEVGKLKIAYKQSVAKFDAILDELKRDLESADSRRLIKKSPALFSQNYQAKLDEARAYCNNNFHRKADILLKKDAVDSEIAKLLIDTFFSLFKSFTDNKKNDNAFNAAYLDAKLITPLRFKPWDKIE